MAFTIQMDFHSRRTTSPDLEFSQSLIVVAIAAGKVLESSLITLAFSLHSILEDGDARNKRGICSQHSGRTET